MLEVLEINYDKNYITIKATKAGDYVINNLICSVQEGTYQIHANYDFIRKVEIGRIIEAQIEEGKKPPVIKKKATKKTKKTLN